MMPKSLLVKILVVSVFSFTSHLSSAIDAKGSASMAYGNMLDKKEIAATEEEALKNAIQTYINDHRRSDYRNYKKVKDDIESNINDFILSYQVIDAKKKNKKYTVIIRAKINEAELNLKLLEPSDAATNRTPEALTFVFVAREQVGKVSRSEKQGSQTKSRTQEVGKERQENAAAQIKSETKSVGTSETRVKYKDKTLWDVSTTNEVNAAMGEVFTEAWYKVIDAELLEQHTGDMLKVENFVEDYKTGNDLSASTKIEAMKGLASLTRPVKYLAIGTLDVDEEKIDEKTGNIKVAVIITGQVLSVEDYGAAVAKVGPEIAFGEGPTFLVAKNAALKNGAQKVAQQLVAKLSSRNIR